MSEVGPEGKSTKKKSKQIEVEVYNEMRDNKLVKAKERAENKKF